jgi:IS6 family transposase
MGTLVTRHRRYRAVDQHGQIIDIYVSKRRNTASARRFFDTVIDAHDRPDEVTTDLAAPLLRVVDEVLFDAVHDTEQYANNRVQTDHGRLKARLRPMRGLKRDRTASVVIRGHAFIQNLRRGRVRRTRRSNLTPSPHSSAQRDPPIEQRNSAVAGR